MKSNQEKNGKVEVKDGPLFEPGVGGSVELLASFVRRCCGDRIEVIVYSTEEGVDD